MKKICIPAVLLLVLSIQIVSATPTEPKVLNITIKKATWWDILRYKLGLLLVFDKNEYKPGDVARITAHLYLTCIDPVRLCDCKPNKVVVLWDGKQIYEESYSGQCGTSVAVHVVLKIPEDVSLGSHRVSVGIKGYCTDIYVGRECLSSDEWDIGYIKIVEPCPSDTWEEKDYVGCVDNNKKKYVIKKCYYVYRNGQCVKECKVIDYEYETLPPLKPLCTSLFKGCSSKALIYQKTCEYYTYVNCEKVKYDTRSWTETKPVECCVDADCPPKQAQGGVYVGKCVNYKCEYEFKPTQPVYPQPSPQPTPQPTPKLKPEHIMLIGIMALPPLLIYRKMYKVK